MPSPWLRLYAVLAAGVTAERAKTGPDTVGPVGPAFQRQGNVLVASIAELDSRASLEQVSIVREGAVHATPDLTPQAVRLELDKAARIVGVPLSMDRAEQCLRRMGHGTHAQSDDSAITVAVPAYRNDIMHPIDLVEDLAIAYGCRSSTCEAGYRCARRPLPWHPRRVRWGPDEGRPTCLPGEAVGGRAAQTEFRAFISCFLRYPSTADGLTHLVESACLAGVELVGLSTDQEIAVTAEIRGRLRGLSRFLATEEWLRNTAQRLRVRNALWASIVRSRKPRGKYLLYGGLAHSGTERTEVPFWVSQPRGLLDPSGGIDRLLGAMSVDFMSSWRLEMECRDMRRVCVTGRSEMLRPGVYCGVKGLNDFIVITPKTGSPVEGVLRASMSKYDSGKNRHGGDR